jgi:hypothetical protein
LIMKTGINIFFANTIPFLQKNAYEFTYKR